MVTPAELEQKKNEYPKTVEMARRAFSDLYEFPKPLPDKAPKLDIPDLEIGAKEYVGIKR